MPVWRLVNANLHGVVHGLLMISESYAQLTAYQHIDLVRSWVGCSIVMHPS